MAKVIGQKYRLQIDTTPESTATYASFQNEVTVSLSLSSDKIETSDKDSGDFKSYIKTMKDATLSISANEDHNPSGTNLSYADVFTIWSNTHLDTYGGVRKMKLFTSEVGGSSITFEGFIESVEVPFENNGVVAYSFNVQITTEPALAAVSS